MKSLIKVGLIMVGILILAACRPVQAPDQVDLGGTDWLLSSLDGKLPLPDTSITLQFGTDGSAGGSDSCNRYNTTYSQDGSDLTFSQSIVSTMMACAEPIMEQADSFLQSLAATTSFEVSSNQLTLKDGRKTLTTWVSQSTGLGGTSWDVIAYNNGREAVVSVILGTEITANFGADGELSGSAGCNDYFASYQSEGESIAITPPGTTRKFCAEPAGVMEQEGEYLAALQTADTYRIEGSSMEFRTADGAIAVQFSRKPAVQVPPPATGQPTGRVVAPGGVNVRSGPGTHYPVIGFVPFGTEGEIVGRSADGRWWAAAAPALPGGIGWVSADYVAASNVDNVPVIQPAPPVIVPAPPTAVASPTPLPAPTATPTAQISFSADQTTIDQGQCTNLNWSVENVQAVWVYPQGEPYQQFPRTGQGSEEVCPDATTTYEMRVQQRNGQIVTQQVTVTVNPVEAQNPLAGTSWEVLSYNNGREAVVTLLADTRITANFGEAGRLTGNGGCNDYSGPYEVDGDAISIGAMAVNTMACPEPEDLMQQESDYLAALQSAATYQIDGNTLELRTSSGAIAVQLTR